MSWRLIRDRTEAEVEITENAKVADNTDDSMEKWTTRRRSLVMIMNFDREDAELEILSEGLALRGGQLGWVRGCCWASVEV